MSESQQPDGADEAVPAWFADALTRPGASRRVDVEGCPIHYLAWGEEGAPGLVFVPPTGGHAHWFSHIAPLFAEQFRVVALDPSGCGDSGRREHYSTELVLAEIEAVCADAGLFAAPVPPVLVGQSAGAQWVVRAAQAFGEKLLGVIAVDGLRYAELERDHAVKILSAPGPRPTPRPPKVRPTLEEAIGSFRLMPPPLRPTGNAFILEHIARASVKPCEGGWVSKFDPVQGGIVGLAFELRDVLKDVACRAAVIYAEHTHLADETTVATMTRLNEGKVAVMVIPGTTHFPQIDSPLAFVATLRGLALAWRAEVVRAASTA